MSPTGQAAALGHDLAVNSQVGSYCRGETGGLLHGGPKLRRTCARPAFGVRLPPPPDIWTVNRVKGAIVLPVCGSVSRAAGQLAPRRLDGSERQ